MDSDLLNTNRSTMIALGYLAQAILGTNTYVDGLPCLPTVPATLTVNVGAGSIFQNSTIDTTAYGSLAADPNDALVKHGINIASTPFTLTAPTTSGQSINYLIEGSLSEADANPVVLPYYNAANPSQPYSGPNNSQVSQNTVRTQRVQLQLKAGAPAPAGSQVTPPVDTGWVGLYIITVNYGQTQITASSISVYPGAPFINPKLPQLGFLANLIFSSTYGGISKVQVWPGNPNGHLPGNAAGVNTPPDICWDSLDKVLYVCTGSGTTANAVWTVQQTGFTYTATFGTAGSWTWTVPAGVTRVKVRMLGGGGGASYAFSLALPGSGGGAGGYIEGVCAVSPGQVIPITVGAGGGPGVPGSSSGQTGGTSSFGGYLTAYGGVGGTSNGVSSAAGGGGGGVVAGTGLLSFWGTGGGYGSDGAFNTNAFPGTGGVSFFGGPGRAAVGNGNGEANGSAYGSGGSGLYGGVANVGGAGASGIVLVEY